ncbi:MAG TPA: hypothetical protein VF593_13815 [Chthoniobacteraceae bacterium]
MFAQIEFLLIPALSWGRNRSSKNNGLFQQSAKKEGLLFVSSVLFQMISSTFPVITFLP